MQSSQSASAQKGKQVVIKAKVKAVFSGDSIMLYKAPTKSNPEGFESIVFLANVVAPRIGNQNRTEEAFAFEAREMIREKIIGRSCEYIVEYEHSGRKYGTLMVNEENINVSMIQSGLAKVLEARGNMASSPTYEAMVKAQEEAQKKKANIWGPMDNETYAKKHVRQVTFAGDADYQPTKILETLKGDKKPFACILEHVFSASFISLYVFKIQTVIKLNMIHLFTPGQAEKDVLAAGKLFVEKMLLHRTVGLKLTRVDDNGNLQGRVYFPQGEISYEILKNGYSRLTAPKDMDFDPDYYRDLKQAQLIGQNKRAGIWKNMQAEDQGKNKSEIKDFDGKVVEIHSGDSLTIERDNDFETVRVFLATVKAPVLQKKDTTDGAEPYAWESKETLRKMSIGKKVRVEMEYAKTTQAGLTMNFASIFMQKNDKNISVSLLEKGLLATNVMKNGENVSKYLEDLLAAEKKASNGKQGIHSNQQAPLRQFADLTNNSKQAREFEQSIIRRKDRRMQGVVEYCFSGMRFKVRLDQEGICIAVSLLGVKTMQNDPNQPIHLEYAKDAQQFAKETLFQKDVTVEIDFADKRGTFFGSVLLSGNKQDFSEKLLAEGLAHINIIGGKAPKNLATLEQAEQQAKSEAVGIWSKSVKLLQSQKGNTQATPMRQFDEFEVVKVEMTDISDASCFHVRLCDKANVGQKIDNQMAKFDASSAEDLERPIKKGTLCAAQFSVDKKWYRVQVLGSSGPGKNQVLFIDYGNKEIVNGNDLKKLPAELLAFEAQAFQCSLAYVQAPNLDQQCGQKAAKYLQENGMDQKHDMIVVEQEGKYLQVVLVEVGDDDWNNSLNAYMLSEGLAVFPKSLNVNSELPEEAYEWIEYSNDARDSNKNLWKDGGEVNLDED